MDKILNYAVILLFSVIHPTHAVAEDFCRMAMEKIYEKDSDLIAVIKINTQKSALYSSEVKISHDCRIFSSFLSVKDPDAIKGRQKRANPLETFKIRP
ncbi:hypothetical protein [Legionella maioricensis]|uniref:Uncharacterized protein n=1 Tax=Legionella maioricensis TaxID=2896528 RepID=A0A9X2D1M7_9GAMM|nr:hypothetical protein [Legionella maioricensis]MCL9684849.1 hypothetical protein [Legionella maioricensis]MCL9688529.1 hypothetical protein [Legionella maioricensis]